MKEHYYSAKPSSESDESVVKAEITGQEFIFHTDKGVFSKKAVDFGSLLLIETVKADLETAPDSILDLGCGYGPIGIALAYFYPGSSVEMADINERAVALACKNIAENKISNAKTFVSDGFSKAGSGYSVIVMNPPIRAGKKTYYPMFEEAIDRLDKNGAFYCVIQKKQGSDSAAEKLRNVFGNCETVDRKAGYRIHKSIKTKTE
jgi:16S rRNA (guanine1207-N2)-methyltransferase